MCKSLLKMLSALTLVVFGWAYYSGGTFVVSASAHPVQHSQPYATGSIDSTELEAFIDGIMADQMIVNHIPGAIVSVVKDGQLVYEKGYGYSDYENRIPVDPQLTLFRVGSVSKLFVSTAVMQLVEQGKLNLDADINSYLDFTIPATFPQPITMRDLLSHTSGFENSEYAVHRLDPKQLISLEQYIKTRVPARVYPPGEIIAYSSYGISLAGYIVERISGVPFSEYAEKSIFSPLGMEHSTFFQPLPAGLAPNMSNGYNYYEQQYLKAGFEYEIFYPAGGLTSTADDMAKFMLAHLDNGAYGSSRILQEKTAQQMHSQLFTSDSRLPGMAYGFMENNLNGHRLLLHGGNTTFFASGLYLISDENIGIFIAANAPGGSVARNELIQKFMDHYFPFAPEPAQSPSADFASRMKPFVGTYMAARSNYSTPEKMMATLQAFNVSLDAQNYLTINAGKTFHMVEVQPGLLRDRDDPNMNIVLKMDETGQAYLLFPGPNFTYIKIPWYESTSSVTGLLFLAPLLFFNILFIWAIDGIKWLRKRPPSALPPNDTILSRVARWVGGLSGVLVIFAFECFIKMLYTVDPNLGEPAYTFGSPPMFSTLQLLLFPLAVLGVLMLVFTIIAWVRRFWKVGSRIYYSLLTLSAVSMLWVFWFWKLYIPLP